MREWSSFIPSMVWKRFEFIKIWKFLRAQRNLVAIDIKELGLSVFEDTSVFFSLCFGRRRMM